MSGVTRTRMVLSEWAQVQLLWTRVALAEEFRLPADLARERMLVARRERLARAALARYVGDFTPGRQS